MSPSQNLSRMGLCRCLSCLQILPISAISSSPGRGAQAHATSCRRRREVMTSNVDSFSSALGKNWEDIPRHTGPSRSFATLIASSLPTRMLPTHVYLRRSPCEDTRASSVRQSTRSTARRRFVSAAVGLVRHTKTVLSYTFSSSSCRILSFLIRHRRSALHLWVMIAK